MRRLLILAMLNFGSTLAAAQPGEWVNYKAGDASFRCLFPGQPGGSGHQRGGESFGYKAVYEREGERFMARWTRVRVGRPMSSAAFQKAALETELRRIGTYWKISDEVWIRGNLPGLEFSAEGEASWSPGDGNSTQLHRLRYHRVRVLAGVHRLYFLEVDRVSKSLLSKDASKLFGSFEPLLK